MNGTADVTVRRIAPEGTEAATRTLPVEAPVAIEYNGIGYAVMMATPTDLEDFALGFSLSEGVIASLADVLHIDPFETTDGWILRIGVSEARMPALIERARVRVSESSCGLCGLENLEAVNRPLPLLPPALAIDDAALFAALGGLRAHQPLNAATGGVHAAAFFGPDGAIRAAREDVGRHNALDKLIGALAREGTAPGSGAFLLSSRCSYELVEKTVRAGCTTLVTVSTATSLAVARAEAAGLRLIMLARSDAMLEAQSA